MAIKMTIGLGVLSFLAQILICFKETAINLLWEAKVKKQHQISHEQTHS